MINGSHGRWATIALAVLCVLLQGAVSVVPVLFHGADVSGLQQLEGVFLGIFIGAVGLSPAGKSADGNKLPPGPPEPPK